MLPALPIDELDVVDGLVRYYRKNAIYTYQDFRYYYVGPCISYKNPDEEEPNGVLHFEMMVEGRPIGFQFVLQKDG